MKPTVYGTTKIRRPGQRGHIISLIDTDGRIVGQVCFDPRKKRAWRNVRRLATRRGYKLIDEGGTV